MSDKIRIHDLDPHFKDEIAREPGCQHLKRCFSCGVCTATCPVSEIEPSFSPSEIIRQILYGMRGPLLASPALWHCARCANCSFRCPQDVRFLDVIQGLRNLAIREGIITAGRAVLLEQAEHLVQELRRRLISEILAGPEGMELKAALAKVISEVSGEESANESIESAIRSKTETRKQS
jgi:heterodisulfide reductase subunit C